MRRSWALVSVLFVSCVSRYTESLPSTIGSVENAVKHETYAWFEVGKRVPAITIPARSNAALAYDSARREVVLFGGGQPTGNETWAWNGVQWTRRMPPLSPPVRDVFSFAFDAARGQGVLFGGTQGTTILTDTWTWDGSTWTQRTPASHPPGNGATAYDATRAEVVHFGSGANNDETWVWNGTTWTQRVPATKPPSRYRPLMTYDAQRKVVVLYGGIGAGLVDLTDTWTWDGSTWTQRMTSLAPPPRFEAAMAFDVSTGEALIFGGLGPSGTRSDLWAWNGATWTERSVAGAPGPRAQHAMVYDEARRQLVLLSDTTFSDSGMWIFGRLGASCTSSAECIDTTRCIDGVCCNAAACGTCETCAGTSPGRCTPVLNHEDSDTCAASDQKACNNLGECKRALGVAATNGEDCATGFAVDGVCCFSASCGPCEVCSPALKQDDSLAGICSASKSGTDPHDDCAVQESATCGRTGACDGNRRCALYGNDTACGTNAVCSGTGTCIMRTGSCDGDHTVIAADGTRTDCGLYRCESDSCKTACTRKTDCVANADCTSEGRCVTFAPQTSTPEGGGCRMAARRGTSSLLQLFAAALLLRSMRRRRASGETTTTGATVNAPNSVDVTYEA